MSVIDVPKLLQPVSTDSPSGGDLEYDPAFVGMVRTAQGKPEQQIGDAVVQGQEPDWREVKKTAAQLLGRSKDLRLGVYLARALIKVDGFVGLADGLAVLKGLVEQHWETVHPLLDPEDDNDPTIRVNTLVGICDAEGMLRGVRETPLVSSNTLGRFSLRDVLVASGKLPAPAGNDAPPAMSAIEAAFMDGDLGALQATAGALEQSIEQTRGIEVLVTEKVGAAQAADFSPLTDALKGAHKVLNEQLARRGVAVASTGDGKEGVAAGGPSAAAAQGVPGAINSREDAIRVIDRVCEYFVRNEPSSPVPILLQRAKGLVSKSFIDIVRDIAPDGITQVENIRGSSGGGK